MPLHDKQEYTNYHFDVAPDSLEGALDRFAQVGAAAKELWCSRGGAVVGAT